MPTIEMTTYYDIPLHCPFCGVPATHNEGGAWEVKGCGHLQLLTSSDFTFFMSERTQRLVEEAGFEVTREDDDITVSDPHDEDDWPNVLAIVSKLPDVVIFEQVVGPPSLEVSHTVFAYNDEDYAKYGESL